jgi:hypothetical protein
MPDTPQGTWYPSGADVFRPADYLPNIAKTITGVLIAVASQTAADEVRDAAKPTIDRPCYIYRTDLDGLFVSTGGDFHQISPPPVLGSCQWGKPTAQAITTDYKPLVGWNQLSQSGVQPANAESDGSFTILQDGNYQVICHVGLGSPDAVGTASQSTQLSVQVNGSGVFYDFVALTYLGARSVGAAFTRLLYEGDKMVVNMASPVAIATYPSSTAVQVSIAKIG